MFPEWDRRIHCGADQSQVECEPDFRYNNPVSRIHTFTKGLKRVDLQREEDDGRDESGFVKDKHDQVPLKRWFETIRVCNGKPEEPEDDDEGVRTLPQPVSLWSMSQDWPMGLSPPSARISWPRVALILLPLLFFTTPPASTYHTPTPTSSPGATSLYAPLP